MKLLKVVWGVCRTWWNPGELGAEHGFYFQCGRFCDCAALAQNDGKGALCLGGMTEREALSDASALNAPHSPLRLAQHFCHQRFIQRRALRQALA